MLKLEDVNALRALEDISFHQEFEKKLGVPSFYRTRFKNFVLLRQFREIFLDEISVSFTEDNNQKIAYFQESLRRLTHIGHDMSQLDEEKCLYIAHYEAKIYYQIGVIWMNFDQNIEPSSIDKAFEAFENAKASYDAFRHFYSLTRLEQFIRKTYALHPRFSDFDEYSPLARLISIQYNLLCCAQEFNGSVDDKTMLLDLEQLLALQCDPENSASYHTIQEVTYKIQQFTAQSIENLIQIQVADTKNMDMPKKKKKSNHSFEKKWVESIWQAKVHTLEQVQTSFAEGQRIPSFLRPRQIQDMEAIYEGLRNYHKPLLVTKPTGTGKTAEFVSLANHAFNEGLLTIIVVPTVTLATQTKQKFLEYQQKCDSLTYGSDDIAIFCPTIGSLQIGPVTIVTQASYVAQSRKALEHFENKTNLSLYLEQGGTIFKKEVVFHPDFYSLLIIDEGHHIKGERLYQIVSREYCQRPKVLFSASTLPGEYPIIDALCQPVVIQTIQEAIIAGELSPLQMMNLDFSMFPESKKLTTSIRRRLSNSQDVNIEEEIGHLLHSQIGFSYTAIGILKQVFERVPGRRKVMIFTDSIDHADVLATMMTAFFHQPIHSYHSKTKNRNEVIQYFKTTDRSMIVAVGALDEGFDDPDVNLILDFSCYLNRIRRMMQRIGRAERMREDGSSAIIINVKILSDDLQLMPRDIIMPGNSHGYLGLSPDQVLQPHMVDLSLPSDIHISHIFQGEKKILDVCAQPAKLVFPIDATAVDIGEPPVITSLSEQSLFQASAHVAEPFDDLAFDMLFSIFGS